MKEGYQAEIEQALREIPDGAFAVKRHSTADLQSILPAEQLTIRTKGKGKMETFQLFPGIAMSMHWYMAEQMQFHHRAKRSVLEIDHCRTGRIGWNMRGGDAVYFGEGDLCLHSMACCADSQISLPMGYYAGISVAVDLQILKTDCPAILREAGFDAQAIDRKFCADDKPFGIPRNDTIDAIFTPLYDLPPSLRVPYYKLKAQEILLYLMQLEPRTGKELTQYGSGQTELVKEIRDFLVGHLDRRVTIAELSKKYLINTSSLKTVFKAVYGMPIAAYVKTYRMQQAMQLLRETDDSIAVIAQKVGYETQGKFTKTFKEKTGILPTKYRKLYRK